jgi:uncharacterized protein
MRAVLAFFLSLPCWALGQPTTKALLWRILAPDNSVSGYVLGTVHSRDARAFTHVPQALQAISTCGAVYGELDLDAATAEAATVGKAMLLPSGTSLRDLYSKRKYKRVQTALKEKLGPLALLMNKLKPIYLMAAISQEEMRGDSAEVLDAYLQHTAQKMGLRIGGIETMAEQIAALDRVPLKEQAELLYAAVRGHSQSQDMDRMMVAYAAQDLDAIAALMAEGPVSNGFDRALLSERDPVMAHRMDSLMRAEPSFFAIGAAHLPGKGGVLALLRNLGYATEAVLPRKEQ